MDGLLTDSIDSDEDIGSRSRPGVCWSGMLGVLTGRLACIADELSKSKAGASKSGKNIAPDVLQPLILHDPPEQIAIEALYAFSSLAKFQEDFVQLGGLSVLGLRELCTQLAMDISIVDLDRLHDLANITKTGHITLAEFTSAASTLPFFQNLLAAMVASKNFVVGREYDYSRTTIENYNSSVKRAVEDQGEAGIVCSELNEEVQNARMVLSFQLDTLGFTDSRKHWQDSMVLRTCLGIDIGPEISPMLFISIATQVALPGDVFSWLARNDFCHQRNIIHIRRDRIIHCLPELPLYLRRYGAKDALRCVRGETQVLQALTLEVAMGRQRHVWLDCAFEDVGDLMKVLPSFRSRHLKYKVCLLDMRVDKDLVKHRYRRILRNTGRNLYDNDSYSYEELDSLIACSDIYARIDNSEDQPVLQEIRNVDRSGCWGALSQHLSGSLRTASEIASFPRMLHPLRLERITVTSALLGGRANSLGQPGSLTLNISSCGSALACHGSAQKIIAALREVGANTEACVLHTSPAFSTPPGGHEAMLIEFGEKVESCAWLYGHRDIHNSCHADILSKDNLEKLGVDPHCLIARLLRHGGLVQFGGNTEGRKALFIDVPTEAPSATYLQFAPPQRICLNAVAALVDRWQPVTDDRLRREGGLQECWILPGEELPGFDAVKSGGFAYMLDDQAAAIVGSSAVFYRILT